MYEQIKRLAASDGTKDDWFGSAVAISDDGEVIVVGANFAESGGSNRGQVYVFSGPGWATQTILTASDKANGDRFGASVDVSSDGSVVVVGTFFANAAYVYSGASWGTETILTASDGTSNFGESISVCSDGSIVAVGAPSQDASPFKGKAYVYSGASWGTETILTASDAAGGDFFGRSVAISGDGSVVAVGADFADVSAVNQGEAYVYSGASWGTETILTASDAAANAHYGISVSTTDDGATVVVGALTDEAYVYSGASWGTETILTPSDAVGGEGFGWRVDISTEGTTIAVGSQVAAIKETAYVYTGTGWGNEEKVKATTPHSTDNFGYTVGLSEYGTRLVVGAYLEDGVATNAGAAFVFAPFAGQIYRRL